MLNYLEILLGSILALIAAIILGFFGSIGSYLGFLFISILIGYTTGDDIVNGAKYGIFISVIAGLIFALAMISMWILALGGPGASMMEFGLFGIIIGLVIDALIGAVGGAIGASINN